MKNPKMDKISHPTTSPLKLFKHQQELIIRNPPKHLLAWGTGTAKTRTAIELAYKNCSSFLIVCPKALKENWRREIGKWNGGRISSWHVMSKEEFRRDWAKIEKYEGIIIDEAHFFAGQKSQMTKNLRAYCKKHQVKYRWLLTATPYLSNAWNIHTLAGCLGIEWNYWQFKNQFFYDVPMGFRTIPMQKKGIEEELAALVNVIGSTVRMEDCVDMPDQVFDVEYFKMTAEQKKAIEEIEETNHIVRWTKIHQICGGYVKGDEYVPGGEIACDKLDRLKELIEGNKRTIVVARYLGEIEMIKNVLKDKNVHIIQGETKDKQTVLDGLKGVEEYVLLVSAGCSEGWALEECPLMIFYSYDFSLKNYIQLLGRIQRINNVKKNTYISLVVEDSIDEDVYESMMAKSDFHLSLYKK